MKTVGQFDHYDSYVLGHRKEHLTEVLGLVLKLVPVICDLFEFGDTVDDKCDIITELVSELFVRNYRIFNNIMKYAGYDRFFVELEFRRMIATESGCMI